MRIGQNGKQWLVRLTTAVLGFLVLVWAARLSAQTLAAPKLPSQDDSLQRSLLLTRQSEPSARLHGTVLDADGAVVPDASVVLAREDVTTPLQTSSKEDGTFLFPQLPPGSYHLRVERVGFQRWEGTALLRDGEQDPVQEVVLKVAEEQSVEVQASNHQIAEAQLELAEHQRVLGVFPNFYASYVKAAEPLSAMQKFQLATRFAGDPVAFAMAGVVASSEQRAGAFPGYGRGAMGYAKRYGAAYTDGLTSTFLGQALLPVLFHQDPRYFVKGTGSMGSRALYAMASMVICKGDNGHWQPNYSNVLGNFASAGLSNAYYPANNRGGGLVVQTAVMATAMGAVGGLFQEFLLHRMTPNLPDYTATR